MSVTKVTDAMRNVTEVDAAKITTGTIPDARIQASAVTAHVDLSAVRQDIAMLALYNAVSDNRAAYNLPFSFVDQFEDSTGLTTLTDVSRNASEYISTSVASTGSTAYVTGDRSSSITVTSSGIGFGAGVESEIARLVDGVTTGTSHVGFTTATPSAGAYLRFELTAGLTKVDEAKYYQSSTASQGVYYWQGSVNGSDWTTIGSTFTLGGVATQTQTELNGNTTYYNYYQLRHSSGANTSAPYCKEIEFKQHVSTLTTNATGTLISDTQTAPTATTKMSGVILYKDNAGTATLGTDLKIYLSANNGGAWTEAASYGAVTPLFSTGVKMVRLGETTVTSGTAPVIKAVWANQAASSKETQLHGWAMNY